MNQLARYRELRRAEGIVKKLETLSRNELSEAYVEFVGYCPFVDSPPAIDGPGWESISEVEVRHTLAEFLRDFLKGHELPNNRRFVVEDPNGDAYIFSEYQFEEYWNALRLKVGDENPEGPCPADFGAGVFELRFDDPEDIQSSALFTGADAWPDEEDLACVRIDLGLNPRCGDCCREIVGDENGGWHHILEPERGCFLIGAEKS